VIAGRSGASPIAISITTVKEFGVMLEIVLRSLVGFPSMSS
jgi:hypothetical protein